MKRCVRMTILTGIVLGVALAQSAFGRRSGEDRQRRRRRRETSAGIRVFRGIPFAAPPVGDLRWKAPQPVEELGRACARPTSSPRAACSGAMFGDMEFRGNGTSEDCLYLNVWTPAESASAKLPVLVYFFGGGLMAGDGSEPRYDGESMAKKGIVSVTINYRLTAFGFLALPELSAEAPYKASGNYGFLDQHAALKWVQKNIAAFGGDPKPRDDRRRVGRLALGRACSCSRRSRRACSPARSWRAAASWPPPIRRRSPRPRRRA